MYPIRESCREISEVGDMQTRLEQMYYASKVGVACQNMVIQLRQMPRRSEDAHTLFK